MLLSTTMKPRDSAFVGPDLLAAVLQAWLPGAGAEQVDDLAGPLRLRRVRRPRLGRD